MTGNNSRVRVSMGRTVSTGQKYEFLRIDFSIEEDINGETPNDFIDTKVKFLKAKLEQYGAGFNGT